MRHALREVELETQLQILEERIGATPPDSAPYERLLRRRRIAAKLLNALRVDRASAPVEWYEPDDFGGGTDALGFGPPPERLRASR